MHSRAKNTPTRSADLYDIAISSQPRPVCLSYTADGFAYDHVPDEPSDTELFFSSAATHHDMIERSQADDFVAYHASAAPSPNPPPPHASAMLEASSRHDDGLDPLFLDQWRNAECDLGINTTAPRSTAAPRNTCTTHLPDTDIFVPPSRKGPAMFRGTLSGFDFKLGEHDVGYYPSPPPFVPTPPRTLAFPNPLAFLVSSTHRFG